LVPQAGFKYVKSYKIKIPFQPNAVSCPAVSMKHYQNFSAAMPKCRMSNENWVRLPLTTRIQGCYFGFWATFKWWHGNAHLSNELAYMSRQWDAHFLTTRKHMVPRRAKVLAGNCGKGWTGADEGFGS
jgi:hypothetical protein